MILDGARASPKLPTHQKSNVIIMLPPEWNLRWNSREPPCWYNLFSFAKVNVEGLLPKLNKGFKVNKYRESSVCCKYLSQLLVPLPAGNVSYPVPLSWHFSALARAQGKGMQFHHSGLKPLGWATFTRGQGHCVKKSSIRVLPLLGLLPGCYYCWEGREKHRSEAKNVHSDMCLYSFGSFALNLCNDCVLGVQGISKRLVAWLWLACPKEYGSWTCVLHRGGLTAVLH